MWQGKRWDLRGTQNGSVVGVAKDIVFVVTKLEKVSNIATRNWKSRRVVTTLHTAYPRFALVNELHCEWKRGRKEGGKSVDDSFSHG